MGVLLYPQRLTGSVGFVPNLRYAVFTDSLATITTAGYLNSANVESGTPVSNNDIIMALYNYNTNTSTGTFAIFTVTINTATGSVTLAQWGDSGGVILPTIANHIATYTNTNGTLSEDPATAISGGNIQAGLATGTAGKLSSFPGASSKGSLILAAVANTGNTNTTISNAAMAQASVISIPDPATATANFAVAPAALVNNNLVKASGTAGLVADSGFAASDVMLKDALNTMTVAGGINFFKSNGVEAANAVTTSGFSGQITTSSLNTAGGGNYAITWTNTNFATSTYVGLSIAGGSNTTQNITITCAPGSGTATLTIYNNTAATALNGTIIINYVMM
jgi:hypothetical protein